MTPFDIERFKTFHRANTSALVESLKGRSVDFEDFVEQYKAFGDPPRKRRDAKRVYKFCIKYGWFTGPK
jgi:hypothetical protein